MRAAKYKRHDKVKFVINKIIDCITYIFEKPVLWLDDYIEALEWNIKF